MKKHNLKCCYQNNWYTGNYQNELFNWI